MTPVNAIDLLGYKPRAKQWWIFELKRGRPTDAVAGQVSRYLGWLRSERDQDVRGAIIARQADNKLRFAVQANAALEAWVFHDGFRLERVA